MTMLEKVVLPLVLALLMFGLGLALELSDFRRSLRRWPVVLVALVSIFVAMPACAYVIGRMLGLDPVLLAGLLLLATCPGGMFSNMITHSGGGDVALSLTLTICSSLIYAVALPLGMLAWASSAAAHSSDLTMTLAKMVFELVSVVLMPLAVGMWMRARRPAWALRHESLVRNSSSVLIALVFIVLAIEQAEQFKSTGLTIVAAVVLLNLCGWSLAAMLVGAFGLTKQQFIAVGAEHSIRQEGLGVFVAVTLLSNTGMVPPLLTNSFVGFLVCVGCVGVINFSAKSHVAGLRRSRVGGVAMRD
jgi:bile acid:Na+ symporter, BASS family